MTSLSMNGDCAHRFLFYASQASPSSESIELTGGEHHHMTRVLRMSEGETVYVTNGRGIILRCRIDRLDRRSARLGVVGVEEDRPHPHQLTLALSLLRKDAFERAVEQCTELGITRCWPFVAERSHIKGYSAKFLDRLRRVAFSAAKQSFRSFIPEIGPAISFDELLGYASRAAFVVVGDEDSPPLGRPRFDGEFMMIVGPEGGLAGRERAALAESGARFASVSPHRLRSETAAVALLSSVLAGGSAGDD